MINVVLFMLLRTSFFFLSGGSWSAVSLNVDCVYVSSTDVLWWSGAGDRIASVFECVHIYICVLVLGTNDSWHLATISGSLISIERFGGEAQIPLYLTDRCVFDLLTQLKHTHTYVHTPSIHGSSLTYGNVYKQAPLSVVILAAIDQTAEKHQKENMDHSEVCCKRAIIKT